MSFDAGKIVQPLDFTFEDYGGTKGTVPEPSDRDVVELFKALEAAQRQFLPNLDDVDTSTSEGLMKALQQPGEEQFFELSEGLCRAYGTFCKGTPSEEELLKLPIRVRVAFFIWL